MSNLNFKVLDWDFFSPNMNKEYILNRLNENINITYGDAIPDLDFISISHRRRFSQITKYVFESVKNLIKENEQIPIFFVSKYGENLYDLVPGGQVIASDASVEQGCLEASNVNVIDEMVDMITVARAYEAGQKVIQTEDSTLDKAVNSVGQV